jgi:hypothetical protein
MATNTYLVGNVLVARVVRKVVTSVTIQKRTKMGRKRTSVMQFR